MTYGGAYTAVALAMLAHIATARAQPAEPTGPAVSVPSVARYTTSQGAWKHDFAIYALDGKVAALKDVVVTARPALDADGANETNIDVGDVESTAKSDRFGQHAPAHVTISARFAHPGMYSTALYASAGGAPATIELSIEVKAPTAPAQVGTTQAAAGVDERVIVSVWLANPNDVAQTITLTGVSGRLGRKADGRTEYGDAKASLVGESKAVTFGPRGWGRVDLAIEVGEPGEYSADIVLARGADPPITATLTVAVKRSGWKAALCILIGIILGAAVAYARDVFKPRDEIRLVLRQTRRELDSIAPATEAIAGAWRSLRTRTVEIEAKIREDDPKAVKSTVEDFGKRVALLASCNASAAAVSNLASATTQLAKRKIIDDVLAIVVDPNAAIDGGFTALRGLGLDDAKRTELGAALDALEHSVEEHRSSNDPGLVLSIQKTVDPAMDEARRVRALDDLVSLEHELSRARGALAAAGVRALRAGLENKPQWVPDDKWSALARTMNNALEDTSKPLADRYEGLRDLYVEQVAAILVDVATAAGVDAGAIEAVRKATSRRDRVDAMRALQDLIEPPPPGGRAHDMIFLTSATPQSNNAPGYAVGVAEMPAMPAVKRKPLAAVFERTAVTSWKAIHTRLLVLRVWLTVIAAVLALLSGLKALWIDNATWGSCGDYLAALLWGAGVKIATDAFAGLTWLRDALGKGP